MVATQTFIAYAGRYQLVVQTKVDTIQNEIKQSNTFEMIVFDIFEMKFRI